MWSPTKRVQFRVMQSLQVVMSALQEAIAKKKTGVPQSLLWIFR